MVEDAVDDPAISALLIEQTSQLSIRIIEQIRDYMENHSGQVDSKIAIEIQMAGKDAADASHRRNGYRFQVKCRRETGQLVP